MKIAVLASGGVDSSVALRRLHEQGHDITAFYLKIWLEDELAFMGTCPWEDDLAYVEQICLDLQIPLEVISLQKEYWGSIISYVLDELRAGRTPNPDMLCNQRVKFGYFCDKIDASFDKIASGHYAQVEDKNGLTYLKRAADSFKDQTYFLAHLSQQQVSRALFPIGDLLKSQVRDLAEQYDLPNKSRKDSQGLCFLGKISFHDFVKHHLGVMPGDFIEHETGSVVGEHEGYWFYTVGQRKGIGLSGGPWYVVNKNIEKNIVYISKEYFSDDKERNTFIVGQSNWIGGHMPQNSDQLTVKVRHGEKEYRCQLSEFDTSTFRVSLEGRDQGLAPGQFAVFYEGDYCLGGGVIMDI